jgi:hypothetical protein
VRLEVCTVMLLNVQALLDVVLCCWQVVPGMSMACIVCSCRVSFLYQHLQNVFLNNIFLTAAGVLSVLLLTAAVSTTSSTV